MFLFVEYVWVFTPRMGRFLGVFQDQVAQQLTGRILQRRLYRKWEYTLVEAARAGLGFELMTAYIWRRQNTFVQYISTQFLLGLCEAAERKH